MKKRVIVIGAGISGMTAAIYLLDNGFDVTLIEKNDVPGGECVGWKRQGIEIDGCVHWLVGCGKGSDFNRLWTYLGGLGKDIETDVFDVIAKCVYKGESFDYYCDLEKLRQEMLRVSPSDRPMIELLIRGAKAYRATLIPLGKPVDAMNVFERFALGWKMKSMAMTLLWAKKTATGEIASRFASPLLRNGINSLYGADFNIHSLFYGMAMMDLKDVGKFRGGSLEFSKRIYDRFLEKGGVGMPGTPVAHVLIQDDVACGVTLEDGTTLRSDYVIASTDLGYTLERLLDGNYKYPFYDKKLRKKGQNPLNLCGQVSFRCKEDTSSLPKMLRITPDKPLTVYGSEVVSYALGNDYLEKDRNVNGTFVHVFFRSDEKAYAYLKGLSKEEYLREKKKAGETFREEAEKALGVKLEVIDVTSPLTYERYVNSYHGSYMSFVTTESSKGLFGKNVVKGLKNFALAGQWLMPPGGLPPAAMSGTHAAWRICSFDKRPFVDPSKKVKIDEKPLESKKG